MKCFTVCIWYQCVYGLSWTTLSKTAVTIRPEHADHVCADGAAQHTVPNQTFGNHQVALLRLEISIAAECWTERVTSLCESVKVNHLLCVGYGGEIHLNRYSCNSFTKRLNKRFEAVKVLHLHVRGSCFSHSHPWFIFKWTQFDLFCQPFSSACL